MLEPRGCSEEEYTGLVDILSKKIYPSSGIKEEFPEKIEVSPKPARLKYSPDDANAIFDLVSEGKYAKSDLIKTLKEQYGIDKEEGKRILEEYDKSKTLPKAEEKSKNSGSLESSIIKEDLKKFGRNVRNIGHVLRTPFLIPTTVRKVRDCDYDGDWYNVAFPMIGPMEGFGLLLSVAESYKIGQPKLATAILITTAITNLASGIYEYIKHVKDKSKEKIEEEKKKE